MTDKITYLVAMRKAAYEAMHSANQRLGAGARRQFDNAMREWLSIGRELDALGYVELHGAI